MLHLPWPHWTRRRTTPLECKCIYDERTNCGHYFYVSYWRRDRHFTWSSEPRESSAACSAKRLPSFLSYFKTLSNGPAPGIEPATSRSAVMRSTDWANPACSVWDSKQCEISKYVHRNTPSQHWWVPAAWCSQIKHYTVVLSHPFRPRSYEEKLTRKRGSLSSWVNGKNSCPFCQSQQCSHILWLSRLDQVDPAGRVKVFAWRNVGSARRVTLPSQKGEPAARRVTI